MHFSSALLSVSLVSLAAAVPYSPFPLKDGFPAPNAGQLKKIQTAAGGSLPNTPLPNKLTDSGALTLQLIALNEIFEVAYFNELINNITSGVKGYECKGMDTKYALKALTAIRNQEELHAIGANAILSNAGREPIKPCKYQFPVNTYESAIALAATFTDLVLSVLPLAQTTFATDGGQETGLIQLVGSIIAQEGEQDGWFRYVQGKNPSAAPFLTASNPAFAFTALQSFIVPGSCPNIENLKKNIPTFGALTVVSGPADKDTTTTFSVAGSVDAHKNSIVYLSGQNAPVTVPIYHVSKRHGQTYFQAEFPFSSDSFAKGLTVAALVKGTKKFASNAAVAAATVYGPGLIEI